jgi:hypothetical protein
MTKICGRQVQMLIIVNNLNLITNVGRIFFLKIKKSKLHFSRHFNNQDSLTDLSASQL